MIIYYFKNILMFSSINIILNVLNGLHISLYGYTIYITFLPGYLNCFYK